MTEYGPELVKNGDFSLGDNGDWVKNNATIVGEVATIDADLGGSVMQSLSDVTKIGTDYRLTFTVDDSTSLTGAGSASALMLIGAEGIAITGSGSYSYRFTRELLSDTLAFAATGYNAESELVIDNVSVREILPDEQQAGTNDNNGNFYRNQIQSRPPLPQQQEKRNERATAVKPGLADQITNALFR